MPPGAWPGGCSPGTQISTASQISRFLSEQGRGVLFRELHSIPGSLKPQQSLREQWGTQVAAVVNRCPAGKPPSSSFPPAYNSFISKCQPLKECISFLQGPSHICPAITPSLAQSPDPTPGTEPDTWYSANGCGVEGRETELESRGVLQRYFRTHRTKMSKERLVAKTFEQFNLYLDLPDNIDCSTVFLSVCLSISLLF